MISMLRKTLQRTRFGSRIVDRGDYIKGIYTYYAKPNRRGTLDKAFNRQEGRQAIFKAITQAVDFQIILETGTYLGLTTAFMNHESGIPVRTSELNPRSYGFSKARFKKIPGITGDYCDSRAFLKNALAEITSKDKPIFLYLDAHWNEDLPLLEETQIVFTTHPKSVLLIDDFKVPTDEGYGYDDYGNGNTLHLEYFDPITDLGFKAFFPTLPSKEETGAKRGCVVLAKDPDLIEKLRSLDVLCEHASEPAMA